MKARVKETGEFIEVVPSIYDKDSYDGNGEFPLWNYIGNVKKAMED